MDGFKARIATGGWVGNAEYATLRWTPAQVSKSRPGAPQNRGEFAATRPGPPAEEWDPDLGLYYLRARYYNPVTGRFMSRDPNNPQPIDASGFPINPSILHKYLYAGGDPINAIDPLGRVIVEGNTVIPFALIKAGAYIALGSIVAATACLLYEAADALRAFPGIV